MAPRDGVTAGLLLAGRAAVQVLLVSANSVILAGYQATGDPSRLAVSGVLGFLISATWWMNARAVSLDDVPDGRAWYATGASLGTMAGAALAYQMLR
jgi:hypothetical protein